MTTPHPADALPVQPTLFRPPKRTKPTVEQLETKLAELEDKATAYLDDPNWDAQTGHDLDVEIGDVKYALWHIENPGPRRCEQCGRFLPGTPTERLFSEFGDNLDEYTCGGCGDTLRECY